MKQQSEVVALEVVPRYGTVLRAISADVFDGVLMVIGPAPAPISAWLRTISPADGTTYSVFWNPDPDKRLWRVFP